MKKILLTFIAFCFALSASASDGFDYIKTYQELEVPTHSYIHNVDPDQYYDSKNSSWSPYPSLRLVSPIFFKTITIEPGYYLLTPRQYKGNWYILFKQAGYIKHIIPCYDRDIVPEFFYKDHIPQQKLSFTQNLHVKFLDWVGKHIGSSQREPAPSAYLETTDLDNNYVSIVIYWGNFRYYTIFRTVKL